MPTLLILGSTSDMGHAVAIQYLSQQYSIILAARNDSDRINQKKELSHKFPQQQIFDVAFDANDIQSHQRFYDTLPVPPDGVITFIGYLGEQKVSELSVRQTESVLNNNLLGNVSILNVISNDLERRQSGFIVGVSSVAGDRGRKSNYIYGAAKAGFDAYLSGLRNRLFESNVPVLTVRPGFVATKMTQHLTLPKLLTAKPNQVAIAIFKAQQRKANILYVKWVWRYIMFIIRCIPESIFKRLNL